MACSPSIYRKTVDSNSLIVLCLLSSFDLLSPDGFLFTSSSFVNRHAINFSANALGVGCTKAFANFNRLTFLTQITSFTWCSIYQYINSKHALHLLFYCIFSLLLSLGHCGQCS